MKGKKISTQILIDIGVSGYAFISDSFAQTHDLPLTPFSIARQIFDGKPVISGNITYKQFLTFLLDCITNIYPYLLHG